MRILLVFLLAAFSVAAQGPPAKQYPHDRISIFGGKHFNPETTEVYQWTESFDSPSEHFWSRWQDRWTLWKITFPPNLLVVPNCLYYDLDAADKVGQVYFPEHDSHGVTAKVRQGHRFEARCTSVRMKPRIGGTMIARSAEEMKCPTDTERRTRPYSNPEFVEVFCAPVKP